MADGGIGDEEEYPAGFWALRVCAARLEAGQVDLPFNHPASGKAAELSNFTHALPLIYFLRCTQHKGSRRRLNIGHILRT